MECLPRQRGDLRRGRRVRERRPERDDQRCERGYRARPRPGRLLELSRPRVPAPRPVRARRGGLHGRRPEGALPAQLLDQHLPRAHVPGEGG